MTFLSIQGKPRLVRGRWRVPVRCACGTEKFIRTDHLSRVFSCGCKTKEMIGNKTRTHGRSHTPEHNVWLGMLQRCGDRNCESYKNYGARGIFVCDRWKVFENFLSDMGERPAKNLTIERLDNDGPYSSDNCIWADRATQNRNSRNCKHLREGRV